VVLPHAGWAFSGLAAAAAVRGLPSDVERVVVLAPAHRGGFDGYTVEDHRAYATPLGETPLCPAALGLRAGGAPSADASALAREHSIEVILPLLQSALPNLCLVPVLLGAMDAEGERALARRLADLDDGRTLFVASSDFVHYGRRYGFTPFGEGPGEAGERLRALDDRAVELVAAGDPGALRRFFAETGHNACGRQPLLVLLELLRLRAPKGAAATLAARYASSDLPFVRDATSVGYASLLFSAAGPGGRSASNGHPSAPPLGVLPPLPAPDERWTVDESLGERLRGLAWAAIEAELFGSDALRRALRALGDPAELRRRQAVFVSLFRREPRKAPSQERLRGCRGQGEATLPFDLAVVQAALEAAFHDERFPKLRPEELAGLELEVTVLSPLRTVPSAEAYRRGRDGLVLKKDDRGALFLPAVWAEAGWSVEEALRELSRKAELPPDAWREAQLFAFEGQAFGDSRTRARIP
jgi:AmmeMemoRadiSam system protein B/AmmeMemoRadiSam system protein A